MAVHDTHDLGRFYWHVMPVPAGTAPLQLDGTSHEVEDPWRIGRCWVLRLPRRRALVVGWWGRPRTLEEVQQAEEAELELEPGVDPNDIRANFIAPPPPPRRDSALYEVR